MYYSKEYKTRKQMFRGILRALKKIGIVLTSDDRVYDTILCTCHFEYSGRRDIEINSTVTVLIFENRWAIEGVEI